MSNQEEHLRGRCFARDEDIHQGGPVGEEEVGGDGAEVTEETSASSNRSTGLLPERLQAVKNGMEGEGHLGYHLKTGHTLSVQNRPYGIGLRRDCFTVPHSV